jgi:hypothetical protein
MPPPVELRRKGDNRRQEDIVTDDDDGVGGKQSEMDLPSRLLFMKFVCEFES